MSTTGENATEEADNAHEALNLPPLYNEALDILVAHMRSNFASVLTAHDLRWAIEVQALSPVPKAVLTRLLHRKPLYVRVRSLQTSFNKTFGFDTGPNSSSSSSSNSSTSGTSALAEAVGHLASHGLVHVLGHSDNFRESWAALACLNVAELERIARSCNISIPGSSSSSSRSSSGVYPAPPTRKANLKQALFRTLTTGTDVTGQPLKHQLARLVLQAVAVDAQSNVRADKVALASKAAAVDFPPLLVRVTPEVLDY